MFLHRRPSTTSYLHKATSNISDLNQDLVNRHVSSDASCNCGAASEPVEHCLLHCPHYTQSRDYIIQTFPPRDITIFLTVHEFIVRTNRIGVVDRTTTKALNSFFLSPNMVVVFDNDTPPLSLSPSHLSYLLYLSLPPTTLYILSF